jgi:hypothetical protein
MYEDIADMTKDIDLCAGKSGSKTCTPVHCHTVERKLREDILGRE